MAPSAIVGYTSALIPGDDYRSPENCGYAAVHGPILIYNAVSQWYTRPLRIVT